MSFCASHGPADEHCDIMSRHVHVCWAKAALRRADHALMPIPSVEYCATQSASRRIVIAPAWQVQRFDVAELVLGCRLGCVVGGGGQEPIGEGQLAHRAKREQVLASQRTGGVGQVIAGAHRPHPLSDLRVAITGQVGVEVVDFDCGFGSRLITNSGVGEGARSVGLLTNLGVIRVTGGRRPGGS